MGLLSSLQSLEVPTCTLRSNNFNNYYVFVTVTNNTFTLDGIVDQYISVRVMCIERILFHLNKFGVLDKNGTAGKKTHLK